MAGLVLLLALVGCGPAAAESGALGGSGPVPPVVAAVPAEVAELDGVMSLALLPGAAVEGFEWELEAEFGAGDVPSVFALYDGALRAAGYSSDGVREWEDELKADYRGAGGVTAELSVERERGGVEVELEFDWRRPGAAGVSGLSLLSFGGVEVPFVDGPMREAEWEFEFRHPGTSAAEAFEHYHAGLVASGWRVVTGAGGGTTATYAWGDASLKLEVSEGTEVEIELKLK